jgi:RHS repeat-associated protein
MILKRLALLHSIRDISPPKTKVKPPSSFANGLTHFWNLSTVALVCLCFLSTNARAQITNPPDPVNRPIPGGHDYIHMLSETVNPADGSVNLNIKLPTPAGRGISVPFSLTYNSGGAYYLSSYQPGYIAAYFQTAPTYGGWGNSLPFLSYGATYITYPYSSEPGSNSGTCYFSTGYTFQGLLSGSHSLGISATSPPPSTYANCSDMGGNIPSFYGYTNSGDSQVWSMFTGLCSGSGYQYSCTPYGQPPVTVFDAEGTIYSFVPNAVISTSTLPVVTWPATIEDRNGNIAHISAVNGIGGGAKSVTDTAGRTLVSLTYPGSSNVNPTVISAGGLTYDLAYASYPADFSYYPEHLPPLGMTSIPSGLTCGWQGTIDASESLLKTITLPNGKAYTFSYDSTYGLLNGITYPDGGWVKYTWELSPVYEQNALFSGVEQGGTLLTDGCNILYKTPVIATRQVGFASGSSAAITQTFTYGASWNTGESTSNQWITKTTTVTTTDNVIGKTSQTIYTYTPFTLPFTPGFYGTGAVAGQIPVEQSVQHYDWGGTSAPIIETVTEVWADQFNLESKETALNGNSPSEVTYQYGFGGAVTQKQEFDFGGTLLRTTVNSYQTFPENPLFPLASWPTLKTFPCQTIVYNGSVTSANRVAETDIEYDGGTSVCGTAGTPSVSPVSGGALPTGTHDETYYGSSTSTPAPRGNPTTITKQCFPSCTNAVTTFTFDETGQALTMKDPCGNATCSDMTGTGHTTTYAYTDSYSSCGGAAPPSGNTNAYLTEITDPLGHTQKYCYGYTDGLLRGSTDANNQTTSYAYSDPLLRLTSTTYPDTGKTTLTYNDSVPSVTTSKLITTSVPLTSVSILDGMGQVIETELTSDPTGTDYTVTTYNGEGLVNTVTNPYRSPSDLTYGTTGYLYDALNRTTQVTKADNSTVKTVYSGNTTTVTDEASKTRESFEDGLGRMEEVIESPASLNWATNYSHDALNDLTQVVQGGSRTRTFVYDSLSRLTSSLNPETGTTPVTYSYDADSNVSTKTDARGIMISYSWDVVKRVLSKTYSNSDPSVNYRYDATTCYVVSSCYNVGSMTSIMDAGGSEFFSYDTMGRLWGDQRQTAGITKQSSYVYNLDGSLNTLKYPTGHSVVYTPGGAGLPLTAADSAVATYASSGIYTPWGALSSISRGSHIAENILYNVRLQPCWTYASTGALTATSCTSTVTAGTFMDVKYNFNLGADNGNLAGITNDRNSNRSQTYVYDAVNRITSAATLPACTANCWNLAFTLDEWANLTAVAGTGNATLTPNANNQVGVAPFTYDASGNETADVTSAYVWNAESEMKTGGGVTYLYDGLGNRVEKSGTKLYWYGGTHNVLDETDTTGSTGNTTFSEYIYFDGPLAARRDYQNNVYYYFQDQVNNSRVIAEIPSGGSTATLCDDADFYPYGGEIDFTTSCTQNYKFQGKERDVETGNDYFGARFYSSAYGRFLSPDWSSVPAPVPYANLTNPQTLNLYAFTSDNPESFADLDGHCYPLCTVAAGAVAGFVIGGAGEIIADKLHGQPVNWQKVEGSAVKGAIAGAAIGLAGPEAGVAATAALGAAGNVVGGVADRSIQGESAKEVLSPTSVLKDATSGAVGGAVGGAKVGEDVGEAIANGSAKVAAASGDQASANFYSNNAPAIGTGVAKAIDAGQSAAESYYNQQKPQSQQGTQCGANGTKCH